MAKLLTKAQIATILNAKVGDCTTADIDNIIGVLKTVPHASGSDANPDATLIKNILPGSYDTIG